MPRRIAFLLVAVTGAASVGAPLASETRTARCVPSPRGTVPTGNVGPGVKAGPIWFVAPSPIRLRPNYPDVIYLSKVLIQAPHPPLRTALTLTGFECATGTLLRFWYPKPGEPVSPLPGQTGTGAELREAGSPAAVLRRFRHAQPTRRNGPRTDYRGYMLFSTPGIWRIVVRSGSRIVGTATFRVTT